MTGPELIAQEMHDAVAAKLRNAGYPLVVSWEQLPADAQRAAVAAVKDLLERRIIEPGCEAKAALGAAGYTSEELSGTRRESSTGCVAERREAGTRTR